MDLDAIPLGLYDHEVRLFRQVEKVLHLAHFLHVSRRRKRVHYPSFEDRIVGKKEEAGYLGEG